MSMPLPIRSHFILDGNYIYIDGAGAIQQTSDSSIGLANPLQNPPSEWEKIRQGWGRSESLHGTFNKLTGEYEFTGDAAKILRYIILTIGDTAKCKFVVYLVNDTVDWSYYPYQEGDINFEKPYINPINDSVKVSLFEKGIGSDFKSNLDTPYTIPLSGSDVVTIAHNGTTLTGKYNYKFAEDNYLVATIITTFGEGTGVTLLLSSTISEGLLPVAIPKTANLMMMGGFTTSGVGGSFFGDDQYNNYNLEAGQYVKDSVLNYKVNLQWYASTGGLLTIPSQIRLKVVAIKSKPNEPFRDSQLIHTTPTYEFGGFPVPNPIENIDIVNHPLGDILEGERVYIVIYPEATTWSGDSAEININVIDSLSKVSITTDFDSAPSDIPGFRLHTLGEKLGNAFVDGKYGSPALISNYLSNPATFEKGCYPQRIICTNGYALKGASNTKFKLTLQDYIDDVQSNFDVGVGVSGDQIIIEHLSTFYDDTTVIADLGELTNVEITRLSENGTTLTFGHKYDTLDTLNGVFDYNTKTTYKYAAVQTTGKPVEYVAPFVVSIYNIEAKRAEEQGKDSTGSNTSEDIYKMSVVGVQVDGKYAIRYSGVSPDIYYISAVTYPETRYNAEFTPRNMVNRKMASINSNCYPSTANITFLKSDRYGESFSEFRDDATSTFFPTVYEINWITPSSSPMLWLPFSIKAEAIMPLDIDALMTTNPYGVFTATIKGVSVRIFIDEISNAPISRDQFSIEGRFSPSTDITKLI